MEPPEKPPQHNKPTAPKPPPARVSAVAHEKEEQRLAKKATMSKVGTIIQRRRKGRSVSVNGGDVLRNVSLLEESPDGRPSMLFSPLASLQRLAGPQKRPFRASFKHVKSALRTASGQEYRTLQDIEGPYYGTWGGCAGGQPSPPGGTAGKKRAEGWNRGRPRRSVGIN